MSKKKLILIGVLVVLLVSGGFAAWWYLVKKDHQEQNQEPLPPIVDYTIIKDHEVPSDIEVTSANPDEAAGKYISYGYLKMSVNRHEDAYKLFEKAYKLQGVSAQNQEQALVGMYKAAEKIPDSEKQQAAKDALGDEAFNKYLAPTDKSGEQGE